MKLSQLAHKGLQNPSKIPRFIKDKSMIAWGRLRHRLLPRLFGYHLVKNHFYYPIPDLDELQEKDPWKRTYPTKGVDIREKDQLQLLDDFQKYISEYQSQETNFESGGDGAVLYGMVRKYQPNTIIEVGSGNSTRIALEASEANDGNTTKIIAIEPYPDEFRWTNLRDLDQKYDNLTLIESKAENIDVSTYLELEAGDFLFIDSSHTLSIGNDVAHLYLRVLPQLDPGVFIHSHDIFYPHEYPQNFYYPQPSSMKYHRFWTEQYLLQSFLSFNDSFKIVWMAYHMSKNYPEKLDSVLPGSPETSPGASFWIKRVC